MTPFFVPALDGKVSDQFRAPAGLPPGEGTQGTHWIRNWVGLRAGLDAAQNGHSASRTVSMATKQISQ
jgi:hypothetical protein